MHFFFCRVNNFKVSPIYNIQTSELHVVPPVLLHLNGIQLKLLNNYVIKYMELTASIIQIVRQSTCTN